MKFKKEVGGLGGVERVYFYCPGCLAFHRARTYEIPMEERDFLSLSLHCMNVTNVHRFNGDFDSPTLEPSLLANKGTNLPTCHSYIRNGRIEFLSDCTHPMAGQTVELPEITLDPYGELCEYRVSKSAPD